MADPKPIWIRLIPEKLWHRIEGNANLKKIAENASWLFVDKFLRMGVGLFVGVWVARYLGPEQFGVFSYCTAFVGLFAAIATLGLNGIVVRDLVRDPVGRDVTLGTALMLQMFGGIFATLLAQIAVFFSKGSDEPFRALVLILSVSMALRFADVIKYWFESKTQSKSVVIIENAVFLIMSAGKAVLILAAAPLDAFAYIMMVESALVSGLMLYAYRADGNDLRMLQVRALRAKELLSDSWPLILSGLAVTMYMRVDQIMLGALLGNEEVGRYSAAARISEVWYLIPTIVVNSIFPSVVELKKKNEKKYYETIQSLYDFLIILSLVVAIVMSFSAGWVVQLLYGDAYREAGKILSVQIWAGVFVTMGVARGPWVLSEGLQRFTHVYILIALAVNLVSNYVMIPMYGAIGAAFSSVLAQATTAMIAPSFFKETRPAVRMFLRSLDPLRWLCRLVYKK